MASRTPTLPDNREDKVDPYNPAEQAQRELVEPGPTHVAAGIDQAEAFANDPANHAKKEEDGTLPPDTNFTSSYGGKPTPDGRVLSGANVRAILKKRGPLGLIALIGVGGGFLGMALFSPGILLLQFREVLLGKFNTQFSVMDARYSRVIKAKIDNTTAGLCTKKITVKCRYSTMSKTQVKRFAAANIEVKGRTILGRMIPDAFYFSEMDSDGKLTRITEVKANQFSSSMRKMPAFRSAVMKAYNPKFGGFADKIWARFSGRVGVTKGQMIEGDTDKERAESVDEKTKKGDTSSTFKKVKAGDTDPNTGKKYTNAQIAEINAAAAEADKIGNATRAGTKVATEVIGEVADAASNGVSSAANLVKLTGVSDSACQVYGAIQTLGYAAKTVRAVQLARYAFVFLNVADRIRDGSATAGEVAYAGTVLTEVARDVVSGARRAAAMDSFGYRFAAYGSTSRMSNYTMQFLAGGGLTGDIIGITSMVNTALLGKPREVCGTLANPWVQAGSLIGGLALMVVPGAGQAASLGKIALQGAGGAAFTVALLVIPELLKDIVAGVVTQGLRGEDAGDAAVSGAGGFLGGLANQGGGAAMTQEDGLAFLNFQSETVARYGREEAAQLSPLDMSSQYTFMGSLASSLMPYISTSDKTLGASLSSVGSLLSRSFASIIPTTNALTTEQQKAAMEMCQDNDLVELGVSTDPFCNVIYGIPERYLNKDPRVVQDELLARGFISDTGTPKGKYADFINKCISSGKPLGTNAVTSEAGIENDKECIIDDDNANFYLFFVDERIDQGLEGYIEEGGGSKQDIAKQIVELADQGKVTEWKGGESCKSEDKNGCLGMIRKIADGTFDGNTEPCGININILKIVLKAAQNYTIEINDINRQCANSTSRIGSDPKSNHDAGNGSAIDIGSVDGVSSTGASANDRKLANTLAEAGLLIPGTRFEQKKCRSGLANFIDNLPEGVTEFNATECNHMHIDFKTSSDPELLYTRPANNG